MNAPTNIKNKKLGILLCKKSLMTPPFSALFSGTLLFIIRPTVKKIIKENIDNVKDKRQTAVSVVLLQRYSE